MKCYELAVKSYSEDRKATYESEVEAYEGLLDKPGMLRYFGRYSCYDAQGHKTYNILLEFGKMDLLEYFNEKPPPERSEDIIRCWKSICKIANAIRTVHELDHSTESYNGSVPIPPYLLDLFS